MCTTPPVIAALQAAILSDPEGGAGGSGLIDHGITLATGSIRTLIRNRQLLWFSFLTGLVLMFGLVSSLALHTFPTPKPAYLQPPFP